MSSLRLRVRLPVAFAFIALVSGAAACSSSGDQAGATNPDAATSNPDAATSRDGDAGSVQAPPNTVPVPVGTSPVRGPADAWVTLIEFGDFECPFCGEEAPVVAALLAANPTDLRVVFKNFPLTTIHPYAQGAAIAAVCAGAQGAFWPMHDLLYANQNNLTPSDLQRYASTAGVDVPTWMACLTTQPPVDAIDADVALGNSVGVGGTPTFFVNGQKVVGAVPQTELQAVIDSTRSAAQASGVPSSSYYDTVILGGAAD